MGGSRNCERWLGTAQNAVEVATNGAVADVGGETADINAFDPKERFDRIVSIEMMEHVRNHPALFERIARWLAPGGAAFAHIFCHRSRAYVYETEGETDWMAQHFFTGGMMPSEALFRRYDQHLALENQWRVDGAHYARTCDAWLTNLDARRDAVMGVLQRGYGAEAARWFHRWRLFFMACSELFAYGGGQEWFVSHYLWKPER